MARELGFRPRSLIKNIPSKSEPWKAPVGVWIRDLHARRFGRTRGSEPDRDQAGPPGPRAGELPDPGGDGLLPQYDTVNEEPFFIREHDGKVLSVEEAGRYLTGQELEEDLLDWGEEQWTGNSEPTARQIEEQDESMLRRQRDFRRAAEAVAAAMSSLPEVERIVLFGSVARPLEREVPRFGKSRRKGIEIRHECKDVDLAVWVNGLAHLRSLQKARSQALNDLLAARNIGVAHHQVDVFLLEPGSDRYLGGLCCFNRCPKGEKECLAEGCGKKPFLRQHEGFAFDWASALRGSVVLYDRAAHQARP